MTSRRRFLQALGAAGLGAALTLPTLGRPARAAGQARRIIFFYFPDGVVGPSQNGDPSRWHCTGSEHNYALSPTLGALAPFKEHCVFFTGLTMGGTDSGSHPGGAKKLLTAADHGNHASIDQVLAQSAGADAPWQHLYLGAQANANNASGDKLISYPSPGQSITPQDDPLQAFELLFGGAVPGEPPSSEPDPTDVSVIDAVLDDMDRLRASMGKTEQAKLDLHLESLREVEKRIKNTGEVIGAGCDEPTLDTSGIDPSALYEPDAFPALLRAQTDLMLLAMQCGLTRVGTLQCSHHTSDLLMSRFPGSEMYDPGFDMRSHQASHYGASHDPAKLEYVAFERQTRWWVEQFAYLLDELSKRPEEDGTMLDYSLVVLCTEVCDGNTHLHDDMPMVLAGGAGGALSSDRLLHTNGARHADLWIALANAMGVPITSFGDVSNGPLSGLA